MPVDVAKGVFWRRRCRQHRSGPPAPLRTVVSVIRPACRRERPNKHQRRARGRVSRFLLEHVERVCHDQASITASPADRQASSFRVARVRVHARRVRHRATTATAAMHGWVKVVHSSSTDIMPPPGTPPALSRRRRRTTYCRVSRFLLEHVERVCHDQASITASPADRQASSFRVARVRVHARRVRHRATTATAAMHGWVKVVHSSSTDIMPPPGTPPALSRRRRRTTYCRCARRLIFRRESTILALCCRGAIEKVTGVASCVTRAVLFFFFFRPPVTAGYHGHSGYARSL